MASFMDIKLSLKSKQVLHMTSGILMIESMKHIVPAILLMYQYYHVAILIGV